MRRGIRLVQVARFTEADHQKHYAKVLDAAREISTPAGRIDLLTDDTIIEIKVAKRWKEAIGQLLCYGQYYPQHKKSLYLFDHDENNVKIIAEMCKLHGIELKLI